MAINEERVNNMDKISSDDKNKLYEIRKNHFEQFKILQGVLKEVRYEIQQPPVGYLIDNIIDGLSEDVDLILDIRLTYNIKLKESIETIIDSHNRGLNEDINNSIKRRINQLKCKLIDLKSIGNLEEQKQETPVKKPFWLFWK